MEKNILFNCPLYLSIEDLKILLGRQKSFCYGYMQQLRILYPERCRNGKKIPANVFADYSGHSLEEIGKKLEAEKQEI